ncbi:MAG TPA: DUF5709 domain-containing protein [Actinocrinis sp.]|jgi:hypothetical protein
MDREDLDPDGPGAQADELPEDDGVLEPGDSLETDDLGYDPLDTGISPLERRPASERYGVTPAEARAGESLDERLAEEEPESGGERFSTGPDEPEDEDRPEQDEAFEESATAEPRAGRLIGLDEGAHSVAENSYFARDAGIDGAGASAEEAAMHIVGDDEDDEDAEY